MNYQETLNLPKTEFSMRAGLAKKEPITIEKWEKQGLYEKIREARKGQKQFILHDGPPYANGNIHIGHALNKIIKDVIVKFKTMDGFDSPYLPGWDCHGLPIEHQLFKELGKRKSEVGVVEFRKKAHDYALKYVGIQKEQFKRLGVFGDWENPYLTLASEYEYWILKSFSELNRKGYIYRGLKPVNWCAQCETALAEAEVEYEDHSSPSVYVKFKVNNSQEIEGLPKGKDLYLLIWTTTPWTLLANVAVAVHHSYKYKFVDTGKEILVIESSLADKVLEAAGVSGGKVIKEVSGSDLKELRYDHAFGILKDCRVIEVDYVTKEEGTGLVHTAPGHGQEDFEAGVANGLEILMPVNDRGVFTEKAGKFAGQHVFKANEKIIEDLKKRGILLHSEKISHSYPHCWRCKKPIIFRGTDQWFLKIDHENLRGKLKDKINDDIRWIPEAGRERILGMVTTRPDWCLSRQRHWGVPIPALACEGCGGEHKLFSNVVDNFAEMVKSQGTDIWFEKDVDEILPKGFTCPDCGKNKFSKTHDILDVWFDSGVSHQAVVKGMMKKELPIELYLEGSDQHRGWFQSSLIPAVAMEDKPPYTNVLTHGFVVDGDGRKMSKSLGNVISPQDVIKNNGADILRLWVISNNYHDDIRLSKEILDRMIDAYRKIRNTVRYLLGNINGFNPDTDQVAYKDLLEIDQWALFKLGEMVNTVKAAYDNYEFAKVYKVIYSFCNEDLSSFYLDILKDRLYTSPFQSREGRSARTVLFHILNHLVRILAPILSFTSEEILSVMPKDSEMNSVESVHLLNFVDVPEEWMSAEIGEKFALLVDLRPHVMKALEDKRRDGEIGSALQAKVVFKTSSQRDFDYLSKLEEMLPATFIVSSVVVEKADKIDEGLDENFSQTQIMIDKADGEKCPRCWNYSILGQDSEHPTLCSRCARAVKEILNG